ncbi:hypothetical protein AKJ51_02860 [candidate division MSBL1 archaeon SCGC-AAA382A20]|uniref:Xylose isomerase-like TIM barrel domain-containing protein n=1 Tax=candidate division MSBL1 archaeon SCGC-AAA382A20 TaxID=1698280 RepID=A0A133VK07_9EURY|nr:hypothetical protein AKJ51_02860 [candidate division MSBL1 archaeon SCGC-AAA382A20]
MDIKKVGINGSYFHFDSLLNSTKQLIDIGFEKIEYSGLSLMDINSYEIEELKKILRGEGVTITAVNAVGDLIPVKVGNLISPQKQERRNGVEHVKKCVDLAVSLKSKRVVCDIGTSTEDLLPLESQNELFLTSLQEILEYSKSSNVLIVLMQVPGRRWVPWDGLPPDRSKVVERYIWPWRLWPDEEELLSNLGDKLNGEVGWAFDAANETVAHGIYRFQLKEVIKPYLNYNLQVVYLANHPGPYNKVWHRLLLHKPLWNGFYSSQDFRSLLSLSKNKGLSPQITLQIKEKRPKKKSLKRSLRTVT